MNDKIKELQKKFKKEISCCQEIVKILSLLNNKTRFRLLCALTNDDFCVSELVEILPNSKMSNVSQHLRLLAANNIVTKRRNKKQIYYSLKNNKIDDLINFMEEIICNEEI